MNLQGLAPLPPARPPTRRPPFPPCGSHPTALCVSAWARRVDQLCHFPHFPLPWAPTNALTLRRNNERRSRRQEQGQYQGKGLHDDDAADAELMVCAVRGGVWGWEGARCDCFQARERGRRQHAALERSRSIWRQGIIASYFRVSSRGLASRQNRKMPRPGNPLLRAFVLLFFSMVVTIYMWFSFYFSFWNNPKNVPAVEVEVNLSFHHSPDFDMSFVRNCPLYSYKQ